MKTLVINEKDNVAVSLEDGSILKGHKLARRDIKKDDAVTNLHICVTVYSNITKTVE